MTKCHHCNKKDLLGIYCVCGKYYCIKHRHKCDITNCKELRDSLKQTKNNIEPIVKKKIEKI